MTYSAVRRASTTVCSQTSSSLIVRVRVTKLAVSSNLLGFDYLAVTVEAFALCEAILPLVAWTWQRCYPAKARMPQPR